MKIFNFYNEYVKQNYIIIPLDDITLCINNEKICFFDLSHKEIIKHFQNIKELDLYELIFSKEYTYRKNKINNVLDIIKDNCELCSFYEKCPFKLNIKRNKEKINSILKELRELIKNNSEID